MAKNKNKSLYLRSLVSFEYVRVNKIDGIELVPENTNKVDIFGTVMVSDGSRDSNGQDILYHRPSVKPESKGPGDYISLTGPSKGIDGHDDVIFSVNLWAILCVNGTSITKEIAQGQAIWGIGCGNNLQKRQKVEVLGQDGSVSVGFEIIREAVNATINIVMMNESPAQIYGTIKAHRVLGRMRMLFDKSANEGIQVNPQQSIPLTRPFFPVSALPDSYLTIEVDLWIHDYQIAMGSLQFTPIFGTQQKNIAGNYGELQVFITFE